MWYSSVCSENLYEDRGSYENREGLSDFVMLAVLCVGMANAMPLNSSARAVVPADLQQLISVDYRALRDSPTATALKQQIMHSQENLQAVRGRA